MVTPHPLAAFVVSSQSRGTAPRRRRTRTRTVGLDGREQSLEARDRRS